MKKIIKAILIFPFFNITYGQQHQISINKENQQNLIIFGNFQLQTHQVNNLKHKIHIKIIIIIFNININKNKKCHHSNN